jgi:hypothetical protein
VRRAGGRAGEPSGEGHDSAKSLSTSEGCTEGHRAALAQRANKDKNTPESRARAGKWEGRIWFREIGESAMGR